MDLHTSVKLISFTTHKDVSVCTNIIIIILREYKEGHRNEVCTVDSRSLLDKELWK